MSLIFDGHGWRGIHRGSDLFDHKIVLGFVTVIMDKREVPAWLRRLVGENERLRATDAFRNEALEAVRRRLDEARTRLGDTK